MNYCDYKLQDKINILQKNKTSDQIFERLCDEIGILEFNCDRDTLEVDDTGHGKFSAIYTYLELLEDLEEYTLDKQLNNDIPEQYQYIDEFWIEDDEEEVI